MIKDYWHRVCRMVREDKLFSSIYISGTALSIAFTMVMAISYYVKLAPIYPEANRKHTLYMKHARFQEQQDEASYDAGYSVRAVEEWFYTLKNVEVVSAERSVPQGSYVRLPDGRGELQVTAKFTDPAFFKIYSFRFIEGSPLSESDFEAGTLTAVVSDKLARAVFGSDSCIVGRTLKMGYKNYRICGVVEEASSLAEASYAQVYVAYNRKETESMGGRYGVLPYMGRMEVTLLVKSGEQKKALRKELADIARRYNASQDAYRLELCGQPTSHFRSVFQDYMSETSLLDSRAVRSLLFVLCVLLLVPGVNLCGVIAGRMESRVAEMGIRKTFGASRAVLLREVVNENLVFTLLGGMFGLVLAWLMLVIFRQWVFDMLNPFPGNKFIGSSPLVSGEMLFSPVVFLLVFFFCIVFNLISALVPAWLSLRQPVIKSMNEER